MIEWLLTFDSSAWVMRVMDQHWLVLGFIGGVVKVIADRTKTPIDNEILSMIAARKAGRPSSTVKH